MTVIPFTRTPETPGIDVSALATRPMPEIYAIAMSDELSPSTCKAVVVILRFVARALIGGAIGEGRRPEAMGLSVDAALRRACDLLDLADELERQAGGQPPADGGA